MLGDVIREWLRWSHGVKGVTVPGVDVHVETVTVQVWSPGFVTTVRRILPVTNR